MKLQHFIEEMCEENEAKYRDFLTTLGTFYKIGVLKVIFCSNDKLNYEKAYKYLMDEWNNKEIPFTLRNVKYYLNILSVAKRNTLTINKIISPKFNIRLYLDEIKDSEYIVYERLFNLNVDRTNNPIFKCGKVPDSLIDFIQKRVETGLKVEFVDSMDYKLLFDFKYLDIFNQKILKYVKQYLKENSKDSRREALIYQLSVLNIDSIIHDLYYKTDRSTETLYTFFSKDRALPPSTYNLYKNTLNDILEVYLYSNMKMFKKGETVKTEKN